MRISLYTLAVACFYFICWTPFWVATAYAVYLEYTEDPGARVPPVFVYRFVGFFAYGNFNYFCFFKNCAHGVFN